MKLDIDELEKKLIERYGKEGWEKRLNNYYERNKEHFSKKYARENYILGLSKFIAEATPSKVTPPEK